MSQTIKFPDLGAASIRQVVIALSAAQKLKQFSTNLVIQRRRNADKGDYEVTYTDDPVQYGDERNKLATYTPRERRSTTNVSPLLYALQANEPPPNTYRLEPTKRFDIGTIQGMMKETFEQELRDVEYNREKCPQLTKKLCDLIKQRVKNLQFPRYKIIAVVYIGQKSGQDLLVTSRCAWDTRFDNCAQYAYENQDLFATGMVYGVYHE